ncbi:Uncharacterised protein [Klebsiella pneumoniae]|nr:Uncharacterised protein [Klebsiella pneumoniae]
MIHTVQQNTDPRQAGRQRKHQKDRRVSRHGQHQHPAQRGAEDSPGTADTMHPADAGSADLGLIIGGRICLQTVLRAVNAHPADKNQHRQRRRTEIHYPLGQQAQTAEEIGCRNHGFRRSAIHQHTDKDPAQRAAELEQAGHHRRLLQRQAAGAENGWQPAVQQVNHEQPHKIG